MFYFDIGIAQRLLGLDIKQWLLNPVQIENQGEIAEQLVAQEILAYSDYHKTCKLYYWHREAKSSNAEVDFVVMKEGEIIPVEVKSSHKGSMKSIQIFLESHANTPYALKNIRSVLLRNMASLLKFLFMRWKAGWQRFRTKRSFFCSSNEENNFHIVFHRVRISPFTLTNTESRSLQCDISTDTAFCG